MSSSVQHIGTALASAATTTSDTVPQLGITTTVTADPPAQQFQQAPAQESEPTTAIVGNAHEHDNSLAVDTTNPALEGEKQHEQDQIQNQAVQQSGNHAEHPEQAGRSVEDISETQQQQQQRDEEQQQQQQQQEQEQEQEQQEQELSQPADTRPNHIKSTPQLEHFFQSLPAILETASYDEMWGVQLKLTYDHIPTVNILMKFLRANDGSLKLAQEQLAKALAWRKKMDPIGLVNGVYSSKFKGLGYLTEYAGKNRKEIFTWNTYGGAAKRINETFGNTEDFIKWRVALMEMAVARLNLNEATTPLSMTGEDPYQMIQVHDYLNVSFLRMDPKIKSATKQIIEIFSTAYPELLREKFFVNVPIVMSWVFTALKMFLAKNTIRKMHPITNGANLAREFGHFKDELPKEYGGKAPSLQESAYGPRLEGEPARTIAPSSDSDDNNENDGINSSSNAAAAGAAAADNDQPTPTTSAAAPAQGAVPELKGEDSAQLAGGPSSSKQGELQLNDGENGKKHDEKEEDDYDDDDDKSESHEQKAAAKAIDI
ncbi:Non-classical phosphatidylinositol transfer protein (PITP) [Ascosphaera aggregata]|nr:Non-classical phosphatidylinositol transfer protein (PITP) [Ascosphaera aggregata]